MNNQDSSIEYTLLTKTQRICLFTLPPMSTSKGYYLDDWKEMIWEGNLYCCIIVRWSKSHR